MENKRRVLTVGYVEDLLRGYSKETEVNVGCGCCNHSATGSIDIIGVEDNTNQTYGYIQLILNKRDDSEIEYNPDKVEFYKVENEKLRKQLEIAKEELNNAREAIEYIKRKVDNI